MLFSYHRKPTRDLETNKRRSDRNDKKEYEKHNPLFKFTPKAYYTESYCRLYNNLVRLHNALPGDKKAKASKIYWSVRVEETLLPYFFHNDRVTLNDLVFTITPGEKGISPFQAPNMDFTKQLQFVGLGREKIMGDLKKEVEELSNCIFGKNILEEMENPPAEVNPLITNSYVFTIQNNLKNNLLTMKSENKKINLDVMAQDDKNQLIEKLIS